MTPEARDGLDHLCDLYRHYPDIRLIADTLRIELGRNEEWRDKYCERNAKLLADNQKFISQIEKLEAEIEKVRESMGIVQAENVRLRERIENLQSELTAECGQCGCSRLESKTQDGCITCEVIRMRAECLRLRKELEAACVSLRVFAIYTDNDALRGVYRRLGNRIDEILNQKGGE